MLFPLETKNKRDLPEKQIPYFMHKNFDVSSGQPWSAIAIKAMMEESIMIDNKIAMNLIPELYFDFCGLFPLITIPPESN